MSKDCNLKKIKEVGDEYKLTFDCGLKMPIKKELIAGLPEPKVGDKLCPVHYTKIRKLKPKGTNPCVEVYNELAGNSL